LGHLYPTNISKYLIYELFANWYNRKKINKGSSISKELLASPRPLRKKDVISHFKKNLKRMELAIEIVKKDKSMIFQEDITKQEETTKLLNKLMEENFGVSCAEGCYFDEEMIDMAVQECLATWLDHGIVELINDEWFLKKEIFHDKHLDASTIKRILTLLENEKIDDRIIRYTYKAMINVGDIDSYIITYIDM